MAGAHAILTFADFEFDTARAELRRNGQVVKLAPQPFKALETLLASPGALVTREQLQQALWGNDSFVDFNAGLNFCIAQLRGALDDPAAKSAIIVSVPRRGYRFVADVGQRAATSPGTDVTLPGALPIQQSVSGRWRWWAAVGVIAFGGLAQTPADPLGVDVGSRNLVALKEYELGATGLADSTPADFTSRAGRLEAAIRADGGFAKPYVALADLRLLAGNYRVEIPQVSYAAAKAAAMQALSLDPASADAHALYAVAVTYVDWDWATADAHFARANVARAASPRVHQWFARYQSWRGEHDRALQHARRAVELAPRSASARTELGEVQLRAGLLDDAFATCVAATELLPEFIPARTCAAVAAAEAGRFRDAAAYGLGQAEEASSFWTGRADRLMRTATTDDERARRAVSIAAALAHSGQPSSALDWLERGANARVDAMLNVRSHPAFRALASEPRFVRLLTRIGP